MTLFKYEDAQSIVGQSFIYRQLKNVFKILIQEEVFLLFLCINSISVMEFSMYENITSVTIIQDK